MGCLFFRKLKGDVFRAVADTETGETRGEWTVCALVVIVGAVVLVVVVFVAAAAVGGGGVRVVVVAVGSFVVPESYESEEMGVAAAAVDVEFVDTNVVNKDDN